MPHKVNEPVGPIGIACPEECPLLGFVSLFAPAIVRGNTVIIIPSESHPLVALDLYQVFETSDVPPGVINIVSGSKDVLMKTLAEHQVRVDSVRVDSGKCLSSVSSIVFLRWEWDGDSVLLLHYLSLAPCTVPSRSRNIIFGHLPCRT